LIEAERVVGAPPVRGTKALESDAVDSRPAPPIGLTVGLLLAVTLGALESLTVVSVMPLVANDLDGLSLYGWVFAGFFLTSAIAIPITARVVDRSGRLRLPFGLGLLFFGGGLLIAGLAPSMEVLVAGRFLQGGGAGALTAVTYAAIAIAYPPRERPRMLALVSTAWLVPAFVGPLLGSVIAELAGWRWAFLALAAFVPISAALVLPSVHDRQVDPASAAGGQRSGWRALVPPREIARAAMVGALGGSAMWGLISFAPLGITEVRGESTVQAGLGVGFCSVSWVAAAWMQARLGGVQLRDSIRFGLGATALVSVLLLGVVIPAVPFAVILLGWVLAGFGCGPAFQAVNLFVMAKALPGAEGQATSSVQLANTVGAAVGTSALGVLLNVGRDAGLGLPAALAVVMATCTVALAASALLAWGLPAVRDRQGVTANA
jgi:MFS family permease